MPKNKLLPALFALVCTLSASAQAAAEPGAREITIYKFKFQPQEITIHTGDTLRWINKEKRQYHSVWFEAAGDPEPDYLFPGDSYERSFPDAGDFPYRCGPHPEMTGIVHVIP